MDIHDDRMLSRVHTFVMLAGICVFVVLPLPLMSYLEASKAIRALVIFAICLLICVVLLTENKDEEHVFVLICAYCAIMGNFLS